MKKNSLSTATLFALAGLAVMPEIEFHNYRQGPIGKLSPAEAPIGPRDGKGSAKRDSDKARAKRRNERKGRKAARARK